MNNLKTRVNDLDIGKLKAVHVDLNKLLKTKVYNLDKKIPDATTVIHINQYNTDKQNFEKKNWRCWSKTTYELSSAYDCFEYKNLWSWEQNTKY